MDASNYDDVFNSTTNWILAGGDLTDSISFESSLSAKHESEDGTISAAKSPLLLLPPLPNGEPCEITITFAQEHELRQVYIRSSARVYELYYTKKQGHDKEYLCTVRCGIAMRGEQLLTAAKDPVERRVNGNEDDWVEVKAGDTSLLNNGKDVLPMPQLGKQDLFEATAEINDAEPCISITLRLLSLQDKPCALVDEVYVFADPIDLCEPEQEEATPTGNSSTSSLMAMFMPTLLQLSRGKDVRKERDRQVSDSTIPATLGNSSDSGEIMNEIQQETNFSKGASPPPVVVDTLAKPDVSCNNVETILHQLVNKVSQIETILTRFEDQMVKPISSIDARLQLVEKKLEQLGKKSFESELLVETKLPNLGSDTDKTPETDELDGYTDNPKLAPCTKTAMPDSSSLDNSEDYAVVLPKNRLDNVCTKFVEPWSENNVISRNEMISAESEIISNEEVGYFGRKVAFEDNPKRSLSINDALASALAGLLSSTSTADGKYSQALIVTAPEFSNEDDMKMEERPLTGTHPDKSQVAAEELGNTYSASESPVSSHNEPGVTLCIENGSQEVITGVSEKLDNCDDAETVVSARNDDLDEERVTSSTEADCYTNGENLSYEPENPDSLVHKLENQNVTNGCGSSRSITEGGPGMDDVLKSVLGFQPTASSVDFLTPVLDVKFNSERKVSDNKCFFEALFTAESKTGLNCNKKALDEKLVSVEDEEVKGPPTDTLSSLEMDHSETNEMHLRLNAEMSSLSLI